MDGLVSQVQETKTEIQESSERSVSGIWLTGLSMPDREQNVHMCERQEM